MRRTWSSLQSALSPSNLCLGRRRGCGGTFPRRGTHARCSCPCSQRSVLACAGSRHRPPRSPKPERAEEVLPAGFSTSSARALACPSHCGQCAAKSLEHRCTVLVISYLWSVWGSRLRGFQCKNLAVGQHHIAYTAPEPRTTPLSSRRLTALGRGDRLWAASSASGGALNSAICYAQLCTTQSRSRQLKLDSPIGPFSWTLGG